MSSPILLLLLSLWSSLALAQGPIATLVKVLDGDTVDVLLAGTKTRVRMIGINTEEAHAIAPCGRRWSAAAKAHLTSLLQDRVLRVRQDVVPRDKYQRLLGYVYADELFVNEAMLAAGLAVLSNPGKNKAEWQTLLSAAMTAQEQKVGMWE